MGAKTHAPDLVVLRYAGTNSYRARVKRDYAVLQNGDYLIADTVAATMLIRSAARFEKVEGELKFIETKALSPTAKKSKKAQNDADPAGPNGADAPESTERSETPAESPPQDEQPDANDEIAETA
jgi:hypothetical protein